MLLIIIMRWKVEPEWDKRVKNRTFRSIKVDGALVRGLHESVVRKALDNIFHDYFSAERERGVPFQSTFCQAGKAIAPYLNVPHVMKSFVAFLGFAHAAAGKPDHLSSTRTLIFPPISWDRRQMYRKVCVH